MMKQRIIILVALMSGTSLYIRAQSHVVPKPKEVLLNVSVVTKKNTWVSGLRPINFEIRDGKETKAVTSLDLGAPASIVLVIDVSGSMMETPSLAVSQALAHLLSQSDPRNEYCTLIFHQTVRIVQPFSGDADMVKSSVKSIQFVKREKDTALYDAVKAAFEVFDTAKYQNRALILISDSVDNNSKAKFSQIRWLAREGNIILFNLRPKSEYPSFVPSGTREIEEVARITGGFVENYNTMKQLNTAVETIAHVIKSRYILGFVPSLSLKKDKDEWRKVEVRVLHSDKDFSKQLVVRSSEGYYAQRK